MYIPFLKIIYLFLERREEREQERDKHQCVVASPAPPTGVQAYNPGVCPDPGTSDPLVCRPSLNPLSHTTQGCTLTFRHDTF